MVRVLNNFLDWNKAMKNFPKIVKVSPLANKKLNVLFDNGKAKIYDCKQLLQRPEFALLNEERFFKSVRLMPEDMEFHGMTILISANMNYGRTELK